MPDTPTKRIDQVKEWVDNATSVTVEVFTTASSHVVAVAKSIVPTVGAIPMLSASKPQLSKALIKKGDEGALYAIEATFAEDATFLALARAEASAGRRRVAAALCKEFILAMPNPTQAEIKVSLMATLTVLLAKARKEAAATAAAAPDSTLSPISLYRRGIGLMKTTSDKSIELTSNV